MHGNQTWAHLSEAEKPWTSAANWTTYDGTLPWETAGGDYGSDVAPAQFACCAEAATTSWDISELARDWYANTTPNHGLVFWSPDIEPYALPTMVNTRLTVAYTPSNYWASMQYGGANGRIDTSAEAAAIGAALAGPDTAAIWNATRPGDRDFLMEEEDPNFGVWAPRVDTVGPARPTGIGVDDKELATRGPRLAGSKVSIRSIGTSTGQHRWAAAATICARSTATGAAAAPGARGPRAACWAST